MSTIITLVGTDGITSANSMTKINANFEALNDEKIETSVLSTDSTFASASDLKIPSQLATKLYVDAGGNVNASEITKGIVEEATDAEVTAGTATGGTGAKLVVTPAKLLTYLASTAAIAPVVRTYVTAASPATWTKPAGLKYVVVEVQAAGGGGGGVNGGSGGGTSAGSGGAGGYSKKVIAVASLGATETVTIGATGTGGSAGDNDGVAGGNASFGAHATATGGGLGERGNSAGGGAGGAGASGDINITGGSGASGGSSAYIGNGGNSQLGNGGNAAGIGAGQAASGYGGGGCGGNNISATAAGGNGSAGIVIVTEHYV